MEKPIESEETSITSKPAYWRKNISEWEASGQSQSSFCQERELTRSSFCYWRKRLLTLEGTKKKKPLWIPLQVKKREKRANDCCLHIRLPNRVIIDVPSTLGKTELQIIFQAIGIFS